VLCASPLRSKFARLPRGHCRWEAGTYKVKLTPYRVEDEIGGVPVNAGIGSYNESILAVGAPVYVQGTVRQETTGGRPVALFSKRPPPFTRISELLRLTHTQTVWVELHVVSGSPVRGRKLYDPSERLCQGGTW